MGWRIPIWIRKYLVLEVEVYTVCRRDRDGELALVLLNELPEGVGAELLLETEGHDLIFSDLRPLDAF